MAKLWLILKISQGYLLDWKSNKSELFFQLDNDKKNFICDDCKNQLVYFHMFKRDVKKCSTFAESFNGLVILAQVEKLLKDFKDLSGYQVVLNGSSIVIEPEEDMQMRVTHSPLMKLEIESVVDQIEQYYESKDIEVTEEYIEEPVEIQQIIDEDCSGENGLEILPAEKPLRDETIEEEPAKPKRRRLKKYKYPINTNEKLTDDEKDWINRQVRSCEIMQNGIQMYKCSLCETVLQIAGSLKKHLRDTHILKSEKDQDSWNDKKAFKSEIQKSRLMLETAEGTETIWKCQRCDINRIFRSEAGLKVHIRYNHIRCQVIDAKFIAQCKVVIDYEGGQKDAWKCPECAKVLSSRDGLRNHIKLEHPDIVSFEQTASNKRTASKGEEDIVNLLRTKSRTLKSDQVSTSCIDCGIQFINRTTKKEKSCRIHQECHKILNVVSHFYQLPKCEVTKTLFSNDGDLSKFLTNDERFFEIPTEGMTTNVSKKYKESVGSAEITDPEAWKCGHCRVSYQTEIECNAHVMVLHSKKLICPIDHMEFEGNRGIGLFNVHMRNRHPDMFPDIIISCTYCQSEFSSIFEKLAHMKTCSEKKFECDHCSRKFFTKIELIRHLKIVSGEISYVCEICSKSCSSTMDLKLHRTAHTNQKSYACSYPECSKAFKTPAARSSHMETHSNVTYACSFCPSSFKQRALLQRHLRKGFCRRSPKASSKNTFMFDDYSDVQYDVTEVSN